jgi:ligand-binding sensor protein
VQVPASGRVSFSVPILVPNQNAGGVISLTATNSGGNTSEVGIALATDAIFADGIE